MLICALQPAAGQRGPSGTIRGVVLDIEGLLPLAEAEVTIEGTRYRVVTSADGTFALIGVPIGTYRVSVRRIGYDPVSTPEFVLIADSIRRFDFALRAFPVSLEQIDVTAAARDREKATRSSSVLRDEELPEQGDILQALQGRIPGLRLSGTHDGTRIRLRGGSAEPLFVINGTVARPPLRFYISSSEVKCVEVRRGQQAAMEYSSPSMTDVYNGVVLIWTKDENRPMSGACAQ